MSLWQRFLALFRKPALPPIAVPAPTVAVDPPPVAAPSAPAPVPPAAPAEPPSYLKIRGLIAGWRAAGLSWPDISFNLQTAPGLGRGLTDAEWKVALASGFPAELLAKPVDTSVAVDTSSPTLSFEPVGKGGVGGGVPIDLIGPTTKTFIKCPAQTYVTFMITSEYMNPDLVMTVNGVRSVGLAQALKHMNASGDTVVVQVEQEAKSHIKMEIHEGSM